MKNNNKNIFIWYILPIIIWMGVIFCLSAGVSLKDAILHPEYYKLAVEKIEEGKEPPTDNPNFTILDDIVNDIGHVGVYGILSFLIIRFLSYKNGNQENKKNYFITITFSGIYGISDELHQIFVPLRSASFEDWIFDMIGVILGIITWKILKKYFHFIT